MVETAEEKIEKIVEKILAKRKTTETEKLEIEEPTISDEEFTYILKDETAEETIYVCPGCKFESKNKFGICPNCGESVKFE